MGWKEASSRFSAKRKKSSTLKVGRQFICIMVKTYRSYFYYAFSNKHSFVIYGYRTIGNLGISRNSLTYVRSVLLLISIAFAVQNCSFFESTIDMTGRTAFIPFCSTTLRKKGLFSTFLSIHKASSTCRLLIHASFAAYS